LSSCQLYEQRGTHMTHLQSCWCCPLSCVRLTLIWTAPTGSPRRDFRPTQVFKPCNPTTVWTVTPYQHSLRFQPKKHLLHITLTAAHSGKMPYGLHTKHIKCVHDGSAFSTEAFSRLFRSVYGRKPSSWGCRQCHYLRLVQQGMQWCKARAKEDIAVLEVALRGACPL